jgi:hypothetical protein
MSFGVGVWKYQSIDGVVRNAWKSCIFPDIVDEPYTLVEVELWVRSSSAIEAMMLTSKYALSFAYVELKSKLWAVLSYERAAVAEGKDLSSKSDRHD